MGLEFNPLVVVGAGALCCACIAFAVARRTVASRTAFFDTLNSSQDDISEQETPVLSDVVVVPQANDVSWKSLQVSPRFSVPSHPLSDSECRDSPCFDIAHIRDRDTKVGELSSFFVPSLLKPVDSEFKDPFIRHTKIK